MSASPDQILAQSYQRLTAGDAAGAERALQPLLMAPRQPAKAMLLLGIIRQAQGRIGEAEAALRSSAESEPRDPQAHYNLGVLLSRQQRHWEAAEAYRNALKAAPRMDEARLALALSLDAVDRQVEAEAEINQCLAHGRTVERLIAYARIMANMQRYALALAAYDEALTLKPGDRNLRFERAGILHKRRRVGEAAAEYEALVATGPASEGLVLAQAAALRDAGRATEADESLDAGIASFPQSVRLHQARSEARLDRGEEDFDGAMTQALSRAPENAALRIALAGLLHRADRREEAEAIFRAGDVRHPGIASSLATLLAQRGALEESAAALARIDLQSAHPRLRKQYAHTLLRLGRAEEAAPLIAAGVAAAPEDQEWVAYHATCARQRGEEEFMRLCDPARCGYVADRP
ncbi:MAG: tetratricopeptide repeat protein, partial [Hyphomonadaceae bacterium]